MYTMDDLPQPRPLARALLRWSQGDDAPAFSADLTELLDAESLTGGRRWAHAWIQILSTVRVRGGGSRSDTTGLRPLLALRLALRGLRRDPATAGTAVLILALGLAAPTVFFSILWGISGRPLPIAQGHEVIRIDLVQPTSSGRVTEVTTADVNALRSLPEFSVVGSYQLSRFRVASPGAPPSDVQGAQLDAETFALLGVEPALGRLPAADEWETTYLLGHNSWQRLFGGDPGVLGTPVVVDGQSRTVIGVMAADFGFPLQQDGWTLLPPDPDPQLSLVARLAPGVSEERAERAVARVWQQRDPLRPVEAQAATPQVIGFTRDRGEGGELVLFLALVAIGIALLVIAVANASNLLLVRSADRSTMMALQGALGATRAQLTLQILMESLLLSLAGGAIGLSLASLGASYVQQSMGQNFGYFWIRVDIAPAVALFTSALVLGTALLAGLLPALRLRRTDLHRALRSGPSDRAPGSSRWTHGLVTLQLALSCAALVATGVTVRSTASARSFGNAIPSDQIAVLNWSAADELGAEGLLDTVSRSESADPLTALQNGLRGVQTEGTITVATAAPGFFEQATPIRLPGSDEEQPPLRHLSNVVDPGYFALFDIGTVSGRALAPTDDRTTSPVAVVSESWGSLHLNGDSPLGVVIRAPAHFGDDPVTVVGVVRDLPLASGPRARPDRIYFAIDQVRPAAGVLLVRSTDLGSAVAGLRSQLSMGNGGASAAYSLSAPLTLAEGHRFMTQVQETFGILVLVGGLFGLLIAAVGLYGLLSYRIRQRRREFGVRLALGADAGSLVRSVLGLALRQILPAILIGCTLAWIAAPIMGMISLGEDPRDPVLYLQVALAFGMTSLLAAWLPARQAGSVDPARTLNADG